VREKTLHEEMVEVRGSQHGHREKEYSGAIFQLNELYKLMKNNVAYEKSRDLLYESKDELLLQKIQDEMNDKFKDV